MEYTECEDSFSWWLILTGGRPRQLPIKGNVHRQEIMYFMMVFFTGYIVSVLKFLWWGIRQTSLCSYGLVESLGKTINYQVGTCREGGEKFLLWCRLVKIKQRIKWDLHWSLHYCSIVISVTYQHICLFMFSCHYSSCSSQVLLVSWHCFISSFLGTSKKYSPFVAATNLLQLHVSPCFTIHFKKRASNYLPDVFLTLTTLKCDFMIFVEM